jgi:hypothetical protein
LASRISELYYSNKHYVWCTPFFDGENTPRQTFSLPPSSTPRDIGQRLQNEIKLGDRHSTKIELNRNGLLKGAQIKFENGKINKQQLKEITEIVNEARIPDFRPLLYVIPTAKVITKLKSVDVSQRAHPLSEEYIIEELDRKCFDVVSFDF